MNDLALLQRLETSLRAVGAQSREVVATDSFTVFLDRASSAYLLSFAVPLDSEPEDWSASVAGLRAAFEGRGRRPRLEYFHELHPGLASALEAAGFVQDMSAPVMTLVPEELASLTTSVEGYVRFTADDEQRLEPFLRGQNLAYGGDGADALAWLPNLLAGLAAGSSWVAGLEQEGEFVSGAMIQGGGGIGELAGVWTLPEQQKQGHAFAACHHLLRDYFAEGHERCWLSAAEGALGVYKRLGFARVGTQLNYGLQSV